MSDRKALILVIEDDPQIRRVLGTSLEAYGYAVQLAETGEQALALSTAQAPELFILDLGLPDMDGLRLIPRLRTRATQEILVLSARGTEDMKVRALDLGADDYLTKPFSLFELLARVRVALRRSHDGGSTDTGPIVISAEVTIDLTRRQITRRGEVVHLTPIEFQLVATLAKHGGKVLTHEQLLTEVWGRGQERNTQYLRIYLSGLRRKLETNPAQPKMLLTVPGVGYMIALESVHPAADPGSTQATS